MKVIVIGGFLGSGKTTTLRNLGKYLVGNGHKVAIIVNEIGEVGVDGEAIEGSGLISKELTSGCICCTLRISMEYTLQTLVDEYDPDVVIIEPTGIAFPMQIKEHLSLMDVKDLSFAPVVSLVDASRLTMEINQVPVFIANQIKESEIVCINKIDVVDAGTVAFVTKTVSELNPKALIIQMSARNMDDRFHMFMELLTGESQAEYTGSDMNSIEMSGVGSYSGEYIITGETIPDDRAVPMMKAILSEIKTGLQAINPDFIGHVKLSSRFGDSLIKASLTSAREDPFVEIIGEGASDEQHLKFLSAVTNVQKNQIVPVVDKAIEDILTRENAGFEKKARQGQKLITL